MLSRWAHELRNEVEKGSGSMKKWGSVRTQTIPWLKVRVSVMLPLSRIESEEHW